MSQAIDAAAKLDGGPINKRDRLVISASSLGTAFEWYDFFIYGTLAALLGAKFFPAENPTAGFLQSLAAFAAGFLVRPLGAVVFGYLGDVIGRKYTFLVTIVLMGGATAALGLLPTYAEIGIWAPVLLLIMRLLQGLALGGEYGGAAVYVAEHAPKGKRGYYTSWIQMSVVAGFLLSLAVILACRAMMSEAEFDAWGWRLPFLFSLFLLAISVYMRLKLKESPVFQEMKAAKATSRNPLKESFNTWANTKLVLVALFGVAAGLTVVSYTLLFSTLFFLQNTARLDSATVQVIVAVSIALSAPFFIFFGWLSDKIGRRKPIIAGYVLTLALLFPAFNQLAEFANPAMTAAMERAPVRIGGADCAYDVFAKQQATPCAKAMDYFTKRGIGYETAPAEPGADVVVAIGSARVASFDTAAYDSALEAAGYPADGNGEGLNIVGVVAVIVGLGALSGMTYGPVAALLVELFPAKIRYTSMSVPYHIGTGVFGGMVPFMSQYIVVRSGDVFAGQWYAWGVVLMALIVSYFFLPETVDRDIGHSA